jgi:polyphosphate kinase 2 (PPK2 family)
MKIDANAFKVVEGDEVDLGLWATHVKSLCKSKKAYHKVLQDQVEQLSDQQRLLYASSRHALLLVFQAMDTAGKASIRKAARCSAFSIRAHGS